MPLNTEQQQIVDRIDGAVRRMMAVNPTAEDQDKGLITLMAAYMMDFKYLKDTLSKADMDRVCQQHEGFYHYAKMLERMAQAIADGNFNDILKR